MILTPKIVNTRNYFEHKSYGVESTLQISYISFDESPPKSQVLKQIRIRSFERDNIGMLAETNQHLNLIIAHASMLGGCISL